MGLQLIHMVYSLMIEFNIHENTQNRIQNVGVVCRITPPVLWYHSVISTL